MSSQDAIAFWLTEEKPDKMRRRRSCLGCGDTQEYLTKEPAPSYVSWFKAHQACRPDKSFEAEMPQEPGSGKTNPMPACPGAEIVRDGLCAPCADRLAQAAVPAPIREAGSSENTRAAEDCPLCRGTGCKKYGGGGVGDPVFESSCFECGGTGMMRPLEGPEDGRVQAFCRRTGHTIAEFEAMVSDGTITLRHLSSVPVPSEPPTSPQPPDAAHTREALLDRSPANPGHKSHAGAPIPVSKALMTKIAQGYSGQSIAEKSAVRKPFIHAKALYAQVHNNFRVQGGFCAYKLIPRDEWPGETLEYKNLNGETGYHGIEVKHGKSPYVMQGPEVTFVCEEKE